MNDLIVVEKIAGWQKLKALVLDSVSSPITKCVYNMALNEFLAWFQQAPPAGLHQAAVSSWRVSLEGRGLGSSSIIIRMSAIRKLAAEAADNGLLAPELAAGISRVKSAKTQGIRTGNWLSQRQARALLSAPDISTLRGLRDRAILAVLLGCGLRQSEVVVLTFAHLQQRDDRCVGIFSRRDGRLHFPCGQSRRPRHRRRPKGEKVVWQLIKPYADAAGVPGIAPHDLRRTCAKLCRAGGNVRRS
jgi:site-specific recombinase XerD